MRDGSLAPIAGEGAGKVGRRDGRCLRLDGSRAARDRKHRREGDDEGAIAGGKRNDVGLARQSFTARFPRPHS